MKKKPDEYLGLEQKVQQIVGFIKKKNMTNTWDLDTKLDVEKKYNKYLKVEPKVGQTRQPSVKCTTYTLK